MKTALVSCLLFALLLGVQGTSVIVYNYCGQPFPLWQTDNNGASRQVCYLNGGGYV